MNIAYEYTIGLPKNIVWKYLMNEEILRKSLPGCKSLVESRHGVYLAEMDFSVGPFHDVFTVEIVRGQEKPPSSLQLHIHAKGHTGEIGSRTDLYIKGLQSSSKVIFNADAKVSGAMSLAGQRVMESAAIKGLDSFFQTVETEIRKTLYQLKRGGR